MMPQSLSHNWPMKLGSVALSVVLWFFVIGEPEVVTVEAVPLSYGSLPSGITLLSDPPDTVRLELRGASREIERENLAGIKVLLNFASVQEPGERTFEISEPLLNLPSGVSFLRAVPNHITLAFDRVETKEVPVDVRFKGKPADGYRVAGQKVTPPQVRISGPASRIGDVSTSVAEVELGDKTQTFAVSVAASTPVAGVKLDSPASVRVEVAIEKGKNLP